MAKLDEIAKTLAVLGTGALMLGACNKDKPATETPGADAAVPAAAGEGSCAATDHPADGHCGADGAGDAAGDAAGGEAEGEGSCGAEGEGSCSGAEGE